MKQSIQIIFICLIIYPLFVFGNNVVVTSHPLATNVGEQILNDGGNAYDAAIAISATLSVVEPFASGLGGGGFWLAYDNSLKEYFFLDARETAPQKASIRNFLDKNGQYNKKISREGPLSAGIPGSPAALFYMAENHATKPLSELLKPAINIAKNGFKVDSRYIKGVRHKKELLKKYPEAAKIFLDNGEVPHLGWNLVQNDLSKTLHKISALGHKGFYEGEFAQKLVESVSRNGGIWSIKDLEDYKVVKRKPISFTYKKNQIIAPNLPSSGGLILKYIFNSLKSYDLIKLSNVEKKHLIAELLKRAYFLRKNTMGDPDLINNQYRLFAETKKLLPELNLTKATKIDSFPKQEVIKDDQGMDTTHFAVVDKNDNRVAVTRSINFWFGSAFVPKGTGVILNNEMDDFSFYIQDDGLNSPNQIKPKKRMLSSMTPTFVESEKGYAILGTPGGKRIVSMVLLSILDWIENGDARTMVSLPRYHHQFSPNHILYEEKAFSPIEIKKLKSMGHELKKSKRLYGNMQIITWDKKTNRFDKANDPRGISNNSITIY